LSDYKILLHRLSANLPGLKHWCLDFPRDKDTASAEQLSDSGLLLQGWLLADEGVEASVYLLQGQERSALAFNRNRPDVITTVLKAEATEHPQLNCGFRHSIALHQSGFTLGVTLDGQDYPLLTGQIQGAFQVLQGSENWLFLDNDTNKSVEQFTGKLLIEWGERRRWKDYFKSLQKLAGQLNIPFVMLVAPSKETVYPHLYPYPKARVTTTEQLLGLLPKDFPLLFPINELRAAPKRSFRVTDTHWSVHGAALAAMLSAEKLGVAPAAIAALFAQDAFYQKQMVGDLGNKVFPPTRHDEDVLASYSYRKFIEYDNQLPNFGRVLVIRNPAALVKGHLLILGSSSAYSMLDYLSRIYLCVTLVHTAGNIDVGLVKQIAPDYLLTQTNARFVVKAPTLDYSLVASIAEKLSDLPDKYRTLTVENLEQAAHPIPALHQYYQLGLRQL